MTGGSPTCWTDEELAAHRAVVWASFIVALLIVAASLYLQSPSLTSLLSIFAGGLLTVTFGVQALGSLRSLAIFVASTSPLFATARSDWPLRVAFWFQRPAYEKVASELLSGTPIHDPISRRLFRIVRCEVNSGDIFLMTDANPAGRRGFVRTERAKPAANVWSAMQLAPNWWFVEED